MEEDMAARYWCHMCSQMVNPITEIEIKCPFCQSGFVEEMSSGSRDDHDQPDSDFTSDRALSLWAPILLGMMRNPRRRRRLRRMEFDEEDDENDDGEAPRGGESELDRELESFMRRRRRNSATIVQLLQGIRAGMASESENPEGGDRSNRDGDRDRDRDRERERDHVIFINPLNRTIVVQGSYDSSNGQNPNHSSIGSLGDYFIGNGLDLLLQHLAENDPNRYGTPPAQKEAIEALATVAIKETLQCSVCLDDFEIGTEAKEMPCKHKFHTACLLPWLELHSSCPVCRFQLPSEESKINSERSPDSSTWRESGIDNSNNYTGSSSSNRDDDDDDHDRDHGNGNGNNNNNTTTTTTTTDHGEEGEGRNGNNGRRFSFPWPFNSLFSSSSNSSSTSSSSSMSNAPGGSTSQTDED